MGSTKTGVNGGGSWSLRLVSSHIVSFIFRIV